MFRYSGGVDHYRVKKDGRGMSVDEELFFSNLIELVEVRLYTTSGKWYFPFLNPYSPFSFPTFILTPL